MREVEGCTISEIARNRNISWRTAKKYADKNDWNIDFGPRIRQKPVMEPFQEVVDTWLAEDRQLPRKQRHTAARIYQRLKNEYGFTGSDRTVRAYVQKRREQMAVEDAQAYHRLEHPGGEAQVDFCTVQVSKDAKLMEYKLLVASFPYSNAAFVYPVPRENQECFLEGLKRLFEKMGGVPTRIWFDNLSAAVVSVEKDGQRKCTDAFLRFCAHYRFDAVFCNPNKGNEKGHVENKCGYSRRNWCVPIPVFTDQETFARELTEIEQADRQRPHYAKGVTIEELWHQETPKLLALPDKPYEVLRLDSAKVNGYGEIRFDNASFFLPGVQPDADVLLKVFWNRIEVYDSDYQKLAQFPRPYTGKTMDIPWREVLQSLQKKPRSVNHSQFVRLLPLVIQQFVLARDAGGAPNEIKLRLGWLSEWLTCYRLDEIAQALEKEWLADGHTGAFCDRMIHRLYTIRNPQKTLPEVLPTARELPAA
ncbi:IS21 family transposase, partial [Sporolituus thermophilus]